MNDPGMSKQKLCNFLNVVEERQCGCRIEITKRDDPPQSRAGPEKGRDCFGNVGSRGQKAAILSLAVANAAPVEAEYREAIACKPCSQLRHAPVRARPQFVAARYDEQAGIHPPFIDRSEEHTSELKSL